MLIEPSLVKLSFLWILTTDWFFLEGLSQYSIPKGVQRGIEVDLSDKTYDGVEEEGRLIGGLGQLVDGQRGPDNFRSDIYGYGKGKLNLKKWITWKKDLIWWGQSSFFSLIVFKVCISILETLLCIHSKQCVYIH